MKPAVIRCVEGRDGDHLKLPLLESGHDHADILGTDEHGRIWARRVRVYPTSHYETTDGVRRQVYVPAASLDEHTSSREETYRTSWNAAGPEVGDL